MTVLSGQTIRRLAPFSPFSERAEAFGMTYGLGPAGYDVRVEFDPDGMIESVEVPGRSFLLASAIERIEVPSNALAYVKDKSSWARRGLTVQNTVAEPGWSGFLTLEIVNHSYSSIRLRRGMPIAQIVFHALDAPAEAPYGGKYQDQERGPQAAR